MCRLVLVPVDLVPFFIDCSLELLRPAILLSDGESTPSSVHDKLINGTSSLVLAVDETTTIRMVITVDVIVYESGLRELALPFIAGDCLEELDDIFMLFFNAMAKHHNCSSIVGYAARKGWTRKLKDYGWEPVREIIKYRVE